MGRIAIGAGTVGVLAGVAAALLTLLLHGIQHVAFGYTEDTFLTGVELATHLRRVTAVGAGGVLAGAGWYLLRRFSRRNVSVTHALAADNPELPVLETTLDAVVQLIAVGAGASLGREGAPRQVGAALASKVGIWTGLSTEQRRALIAAGAGAGLSAAYNVPIAGVVFALEILLTRGTRRAAFAPTVVACVIATMVAWPFLGHNPTYQLPRTAVGLALYGFIPVLAVTGAVVGIAFRALMTRVRTHAPGGWRAALSIPVAFVSLGATAIVYPQLLGNGKNLAELALTGSLGLSLAAALTLFKPIATAGCLRSGAIGGLLTPSFATGATLGALLASLVPASWGVPLGGAALLGAAAVFAVVQRAPWTAVALAIDLCHPAPDLLIPIVGVVAVAASTERALHSKRRRVGIE